MKLIVVLVVLALRRLDISWPAWLHQGDDRGKALSGWVPAGLPDGLAWVLKVLVPALVVGVALQFIGHYLAGVLAWLLGGLLLLWLLGTDSEFRQLDELIVRGRMKDADQFASLAHAHFGTEGVPGDTGYFSRLCHDISHREAVRLFSILFYLVTLGYGAALLYMLNLWLANRDEEGCEWARICEAAFHWLPARLLILALALGGDFRRVMEAVDGRWWSWEDSGEIFVDALAAALESDEDEPSDLSGGVALLEDLQALLWRVLAIWLILAAIWVLLVA